MHLRDHAVFDIVGDRSECGAENGMMPIVQVRLAASFQCDYRKAVLHAAKDYHKTCALVYNDLPMMRWTLKKLLGIGCVLFGLFALVTPFTPGAWLIFVGLELLGLMFLLPRCIRDPWEKFKAKLSGWFRRRLAAK